MINVMLVDDHWTIHNTIMQILKNVDDIKIKAQAQNGQEAIRLCDETRPDVILMDVMMPEMDGIEATRIIHEKYPDLPILGLSSFDDGAGVRMMLNNGAAGYILKDSLVKDLVSTIRLLHQGRSIFSREITDMLLRQQTEPQQDFGLTAREKEILILFANGMSHHEMAQKLNISRSTVKFHIANVLEKFGVETRAEAIVLAVRNNLL
jgi:two-component system, NarL family, response regulator LiaR